MDSRFRGNDDTYPVRRPLVIPAKAGIHFAPAVNPPPQGNGVMGVKPAPAKAGSR